MSRATNQDATLPWYRQFWPWLLIALPASVVIAGFATLFIANRYADDLVVHDYYKNGLAINRQLAKQKAAEARGIAAQLAIAEQIVTVRMQGLVEDQSLTLRFSHPLEADRDFRLVLERIAPGFYQAPLTHRPDSRWHWILEGGAAQPWRLDGVVTDSDLH